MPAVCATHDSLAVYSTMRSRHTELDAFATLDRVRAAADAGQLRLLRADCPLELTEELVTREAKYSFVHFLECRDCGAFLFFGIHIRGTPILKTVPFENIDHWPWDNTETQIDNMPEYLADTAR